MFYIQTIYPVYRLDCILLCNLDRIVRPDHQPQRTESLVAVLGDTVFPVRRTDVVQFPDPRNYVWTVAVCSADGILGPMNCLLLIVALAVQDTSIVAYIYLLAIVSKRRFPSWSTYRRFFLYI